MKSFESLYNYHPVAFELSEDKLDVLQHIYQSKRLVIAVGNHLFKGLITY